MTLPAVLLHGFAGTGRAWDGVRAELGAGGPAVSTPDLPGHGSRAMEPVSFATCMHAALLDAPGEFVLCGYSMGGRLALRIALEVPSRVKALVLVSTTAGIEDPSERQERVASDEELAGVTELGSIEDFMRRWGAQPLFASDPPAAQTQWRADMSRNTPAGLAASLRAVGAGTQGPVWDRVGELDMPARVLVGELDEKYVALGRRLQSDLPRATLTIVAGAGHALPRMAPADVAEALRGACEAS